MATRKKPTRKKRSAKPKRPAASATLKQWEAYEKRYDKWEKNEKQKDTDHDKAVKEWENEKKRKEKLKDSIGKIKGKKR